MYEQNSDLNETMAKDLLTYFFFPYLLSTRTESFISFPQYSVFAAAAAVCILTFTILYYYSSHLKSNGVYLVDFACFSPPDDLRAPIPHFMEQVERSDFFDRNSIDFQQMILERSGIGDEACEPISAHESPPGGSFKQSLEEIQLVLFTIVKELFSKHNVNPKSIDILISNCSIFCPIPSITTMIINKFGLRSNVKSVNLSGMGCSAGILSVSLAKDLLKVHNNSLALVLSMEAITPNGYRGNFKSMLIANAIFRMGGAAILFSNRNQDKNTAKYKLLHLVRTHVGSDQRAYVSVYQKPDEDGEVGVSISRSLLHVAGNALRINISQLGPLVLPYTEQIRYGLSLLCRKIYVPNFKTAFEHFCIHAGGKAIIDAVESNLRLGKEDGEASRMTLYRFGNTSSSSVWYELCYLDAKGKVKKGDRVWQIAFGSGFKTNSAVWKCVREIDRNEKNAWSDRIDLYPVDVGRFN